MTKSNCNSPRTMFGYLLVCLSLVLVVKSSAEVDWCSPALSCMVKDQVYQHTMCLYKNQTSTPRCKNISNVQTYPGRFEMLKKHNQLREMVATGKVGQWPTASAMKKLSYDNVLEKIAYHWATQCSAGHDDCRKTKRWPVVSQNVFELARDEPIDYKMWNPATVVDDWFRDIYLTNPGNYSGEDASFAQMIHDKTEKIGCADVQYEVVGNEDLKPRYRRLIVCNYGPGVEPGASQLYEEGPTCSKCPSGIRFLCGGRVLGHQKSSGTDGDSSPKSKDDASSPKPKDDASSPNPKGDSSPTSIGNINTTTSIDGDSSPTTIDGNYPSTGASAESNQSTVTGRETDTAPPDTPPEPTNSTDFVTVDWATRVEVNPEKFTGLKGSPLLPTVVPSYPSEPSGHPHRNSLSSMLIAIVFLTVHFFIGQYSIP